MEPNCSPVTAGAARARATSFILSCRFCFDDSVMWSLAKSRMRLCHHSQAFGKRHAPPRDPRAPAGGLIALSIVSTACFIRSGYEFISRRLPAGREVARAFAEGLTVMTKVASAFGKGPHHAVVKTEPARQYEARGSRSRRSRRDRAAVRLQAGCPQGLPIARGAGAAESGAASHVQRAFKMCLRL